MQRKAHVENFCPTVLKGSYSRPVQRSLSGLREQCSIDVGILLLTIREIFHGQKFGGIQITVTCLWQAH